MTENLNFAIIGAGRIGQVHAQNLSQRVEGARVKRISDLYLDAAEKTARRYNIPLVDRDAEAIFSDPEIDGVLICSSTDTHADYIEAAAAAGKAIFCEKPIDLDLSVIDRALAAVERAGVKLQIGFNRRFDPNFRHLRESVRAGAIGTPHIVRITSRDPEPPPIAYVERSGGLFVDMTIHDFDMARYLIDDEVEEIYAVGSSRVDPAIGRAGDIDTAVVTLRYRGGAFGTIDNSRQAVYGYDQRAEVFGSEGVLACENETPHRVLQGGANGMISAQPLYFFLERYLASYAAEISAFVDAIRADTTPVVTGADGRIPVLMAQAANLSLREHRPVRLDEIDPLKVG